MDNIENSNGNQFQKKSYIPVIKDETFFSLQQDIQRHSNDESEYFVKELKRIGEENPKIAIVIYEFTSKDKKYAIQGMISMYKLIEKQLEADEMNKKFRI